MSTWFKENGFLSEEGERALTFVKEQLNDIMLSMTVEEMSVQELQLLGTNLSKIVGDSISEKITYKKKQAKLAATFSHLNDEQFEDYLEEKYGSDWRFRTLTPEELARVPVLSQEKILELLQEGSKYITEVFKGGIRFPRK